MRLASPLAARRRRPRRSRRARIARLVAHRPDAPPRHLGGRYFYERIWFGVYERTRNLNDLSLEEAREEEEDRGDADSAAPKRNSAGRPGVECVRAERAARDAARDREGSDRMHVATHVVSLRRVRPACVTRRASRRV